MVPFPYSEVSEGKEHDAYLAAEELRTKPDGRGLLLPPVKKETVLGIRSIWDKIDSPASQDAVGDMYDSVPYGILRHYIKTWLQLKHRSEAGNVIFFAAVKHNAKRREGTFSGLYLHDWKNLDPKRALEDAKQAILHDWAFSDVPPEKKKQMIRELEILLPHAIETADLIGKYAKYVHTHIYWNDKRKKWQLTARLFMNHISRGTADPRMEVYQLFGPEAIKKIHKMHRIIYELTKPVSRVVFERPSGVEEFLDEREKEEVEREVQELLKRLQEPEKTVPKPQKRVAIHTGQRQEKVAQTNHVGEASAKRQEEVQGRKPAEEVPSMREKRITVSDVSFMRPEKHPETGLPIVRVRNQIAVLPPHKHLENISSVYPEAIAPSAVSLIESLIGTGGIRDPWQIWEGIAQMLNVLREYRRELQKGTDIRDAGRKILQRTRALRQSTKKVHIREALFYVELFITKHNTSARSILGYTRDHAIMELSADEVQLAEAKKLVEDVLRNPEVYGINLGENDAVKKINELIKDRLGGPKPLVVGFTHMKKVNQ